MLAPTGELNATPMTPDGEGLLQGVQPRDGTGVPVMGRVRIASMTEAAVEIVRPVEMSMPPTVVTPVKPADMMGEVNVCRRLVAGSRTRGERRGGAEVMPALAWSPVCLLPAWEAARALMSLEPDVYGSRATMMTMRDSPPAQHLW
jgi:hypothetical protein